MRIVSLFFSRLRRGFVFGSFGSRGSLTPVAAPNVFLAWGRMRRSGFAGPNCRHPLIVSPGWQQKWVSAGNKSGCPVFSSPFPAPTGRNVKAQGIALGVGRKTMASPVGAE